MEYFVVDYDNGRIAVMQNDNIADLQQFIRDLDETYSDSWFDNAYEAKGSLMEYLGIDKLTEII